MAAKKKVVDVEDASEEAASVPVNLAKFLSRPAEFAKFDIWLIGDTPLIVHAWSEKAKREMLSKQVKAVQEGGKEARNPKDDFESSIYRLSKTEYGFPAMGIKNAILSCAHKDKGLPRSTVQTALWVDSVIARQRTAEPGATCDMPLVKLYCSPPEMREDMVRVGVGMSKTSSLAYRAQFTNWAIHLTGRFNASVLSDEAIMYLLREAGAVIGLGEWRPEKKGVFGTFHLCDAAEQRAWDRYASGKGKIPANVALMAAE